MWVGLIVVGASVAFQSPSAPAIAQSTVNWSTYLNGIARQGFAAQESAINATTAPNLTLTWSATSPGNLIFSQPIVDNGLVYWGSFDGYEHATTTAGTPVWSQFIGTTTPGGKCSPTSAGVASSATVHPVTIGSSTSVVYVGGGDAQLYALDAQTGAILWVTRLGASPNVFIWSSPAVYHGNVYIGVASFGDCPLVQGQVVQLDAKTGKVKHVFSTVPNGCIGGGVWSSPTIDDAAGTIYFATGNSGRCMHAEPLAQAVVEVHASDLSLVGSWAVPRSQRTVDPDFGATVTLFSARSGGQTRNLLGVVNKNGIYYAFARDQLSSGPVWQQRIANGGPDPEGGSADISPAAFANHTLFVAGSTTTIQSVTCPGTIAAVRPADGHVLWQDCLSDGPILGAVTAVPGVVTVGAGSNILLIDAKTGAILLSYATAAPVLGAASVANGVLYQGDSGGTLYALAPPAAP